MLRAGSIVTNPENGNQFRLEQILGQGAMGQVFKALQANPRRYVALKFILGTSDDEAKARFLREARALERIKHPNVMQFVDFGFDPNLKRTFIASEYIEGGKSLQNIIIENQQNTLRSGHRERQDAPAPWMYSMAHDLSGALTMAHQAGIVHRDLKPENVLVKQTPEGLKGILSDFGLAKLEKTEDQDFQTRASQVVGTPYYMAPEYILNRITNFGGYRASDQYGWGLIMFELLTETLPFERANDIYSLAENITKPDHKKKNIREVNPNIPDDFAKIIMRTIKTNPDERFGSMAEVRDRIFALLHSQTTISTRPDISVAGFSRNLLGQTVDVPLEKILGHPEYFGPYQVVKELAEGGMGKVYEGFDKKLDRPVAIKVIAPALLQDTDSLARFEREKSVLARMNHPNILKINYFGQTDNGINYLVTEFIKGEHWGQETLNDRFKLSKGKMTWNRYLLKQIETAKKVASGMSHAHSQGVLHRDIKPDNIMLNHGNPIIIDFGAAADLESRAQYSQSLMEGQDMRLTQIGQTLGSPKYTSPEQAQGLAAEAGPAADLYSLGATLFFSLTGREPIEDMGEHRQTYLIRVATEDRPKIKELEPNVPSKLADLIDASLTVDSQQRCSNFLSAAEKVLNKPLSTNPSYCGILEECLEKIANSVKKSKKTNYKLQVKREKKGMIAKVANAIAGVTIGSILYTIISSTPVEPVKNPPTAVAANKNADKPVGNKTTPKPVPKPVTKVSVRTYDRYENIECDRVEVRKYKLDDGFLKEDRSFKSPVKVDVTSAEFELEPGMYLIECQEAGYGRSLQPLIVGKDTPSSLEIEVAKEIPGFAFVPKGPFWKKADGRLVQENIAQSYHIAITELPLSTQMRFALTTGSRLARKGDELIVRGIVKPSEIRTRLPRGPSGEQTVDVDDRTYEFTLHKALTKRVLEYVPAANVRGCFDILTHDFPASFRTDLGRKFLGLDVSCATAEISYPTHKQYEKAIAPFGTDFAWGNNPDGEFIDPSKISSVEDCVRAYTSRHPAGQDVSVYGVRNGTGGLLELTGDNMISNGCIAPRPVEGITFLYGTQILGQTLQDNPKKIKLDSLSTKNPYGVRLVLVPK